MATEFEEIPVSGEEKTEKETVPGEALGTGLEENSKIVEETLKKSKKIRSEKQQIAFQKAQEKRKANVLKRREDSGPAASLDKQTEKKQVEASDSESSEDLVIEAPKRRKRKKKIIIEPQSDSSSEEIIIRRSKSHKRERNVPDLFSPEPVRPPPVQRMRDIPHLQHLPSVRNNRDEEYENLTFV